MNKFTFITPELLKTSESQIDKSGHLRAHIMSSILSKTLILASQSSRDWFYYFLSYPLQGLINFLNESFSLNYFLVFSLVSRIGTRHERLARKIIYVERKNNNINLCNTDDINKIFNYNLISKIINISL